MAKGKNKKQSGEPVEPVSPAASPSENPSEPPPPPAPAGLYDREPEGGAGAIVFLGIVGILLALAVVVGLLQGR